VELLTSVERADALPALPAPPPPAPSPFAATPTLLRFGILIQKKIGPVRHPVDEALETGEEMAALARDDDATFDKAPPGPRDDCHAATALLHICSASPHMGFRTMPTPPVASPGPRLSPQALPRQRPQRRDETQPAVWRQFAAPFTPFVSFVCSAASGIITGLVRTSPEAYCPASTVVSVVLHAVAFAVALIVRPSIFAYENFVAVLSDAFTLGAAICTLLLAQADTTTTEDRGVALKSAVQVMGVIATVVSTSGAVLSLARAACMALGQVKAVPLAQFLRDVDARIEWFLLADMEGEGDIWI
jgi:hypothetical protein